MTTEDDFRAALAANPSDAHLRLVFADWLDEQERHIDAALMRVLARPAEDGLRLAFADACEAAGDAAEFCRSCGGTGNGAMVSSGGHGAAGKSSFAKCHACNGLGRPNCSLKMRAEFVRVQCELAQTMCCELCHTAGYTRCVCTRDALRKRARAIIDGNGALWHWLKATRAPVGKWGDWSWSGTEEECTVHAYRDGTEVPVAEPSAWTFRRGFVEIVACTAGEWLNAALHGIREHHHIQTVTLTTPVRVRRAPNGKLQLEGDGQLYDTALPWKDRKRPLPEVLADVFPGIQFEAPKPDPHQWVHPPAHPNPSE